ncbi:MAG: hypothetical protein HY858_09930 [Candidatus Solibacter usitatus]|nr:hypothetical protein [Candidatus Solibacter usitatus]
MARAATLSTTIDSAVKRALVLYTRRHGRKIGFVVEQAIVELIEDEADLEAWRRRRDEPTVAWADVLKAHRRAAAK